MIDSAPKALARPRLEKIVQGLGERMNAGVERMANEVSDLRKQLEDMERQHVRDIASIQVEEQKTIDRTCSQWDEKLLSDWDAAESLAYSAIFDTATKEGKLRRQAREAVSAAVLDARNRISQIEDRFMQAKNQPISRLNGFRTQNEAYAGKLVSVQQAALTALTARSFRAPKTQSLIIDVPEFESSNEAIIGLKDCITRAEKHIAKLADNSVVKFFESAWWWAICAVFFLSVFGGIWVGLDLAPLVSMAVSAVTTIVLALLGMLGVRPWHKRIVAAEYPKVVQLVELGGKINQASLQLAVEENDKELRRLASIRDQRVEAASAWREQQRAEITEKLNKDIEELQANAKEKSLLASRKLEEAVTSFEVNEKNDVDGVKEKFAAEMQRQSELMDAHRSDIDRAIETLTRGGAMRLESAAGRALKACNRCRDWCDEYFPEWSQLANQSQWPDVQPKPVVPLGAINIANVLPEAVRGDQSHIPSPVLYSPIDDGYLVIRADPMQAEVQQLLQNLVMRLFTSLPADKVQACIIDPPGLGRDFGWLMHLSDFDPDLVSHRVWTQQNHIVKKLQDIAMHAEDFIQQSLRDRYSDISSYNQEAGALAEAYKVLIWSSYPAGMEDQAWRALQSILDTGPRCGIIPIFVVHPDQELPKDVQETMQRRGLHVEWNAVESAFFVQRMSLENLPLELEAKASSDQTSEIVQTVGKRSLLANRIEVPLDRVLNESREWWNGDSSRSLEIPVGLSGVDHVQSIKLGVGTAQHAIIAGKTGSGKSSFLHAMITSAAMKYSPNELRMVLLDFKKGVEFQVYADNELPHADIIGIESHREFGLSALEYIDGCLQRRGELFRSAGVQDLASWSVVHPDQPMPRMLVIIDEFQELFVEDDKLSSQASLILDRIVRQGRSFGVHAVLSSQTLGGAYSLPRTTMGQMAVRIALQCDTSDAQVIFAEDNPAASRLKHPGQAIYNDAGGKIEGNQPMQVGWISKSSQTEFFSEIELGYKNDDETTNLLGKSVVFAGNQAAVWSAEAADKAVSKANVEINSQATWCIAGESVAISPAVVFPLTNQAGRNAIVVGADDEMAAAVLNSVSHAFAKQYDDYEIWNIQGSRPTDAKTLALSAQWKDSFGDKFQESDTRGADGLIEKAYQLLNSRMESDSESHKPLLINILQLSRLRSLRHEEDFSSFGEEPSSPDKHLEAVLRDGPANDIHVVLWADGYSTVNRWLSRSSLREIEVRLLMQMSANDSTNLIESVAASRLGERVMLCFDDAIGQEQKFRPFDLEGLSAIGQWLA